MVITSVLMLALATFATAASSGWKHSDDEFKTRNADSRSVAQMQDALSKMLCVVQVNPGDTAGGAAYLFCWQKDSFGGSADKKAQFGEMALIEYEPSTKAVWLYQVKNVSAMTASELTAAGSESWGDYTSPAIVTYFKTSSIVAPRTPLVGGFFGSSNGGIQVVAAQFARFTATNGKPLASYRLLLGDSIASVAAYGNVALRAAQTPANLQ